MLELLITSFPFVLPLVLLFCTVFLFAVALTGSRAHAHRTRHQFELQSRLLDKFSSPEELRQFLDSEAGKRLLGERRPFASGPKERILRSVQAGIVLIVVGSAAYGMKASGAGDVGLMASALGAGLLLSAAVVYVLSKRWGLFNGQAR